MDVEAPQVDSKSVLKYFPRSMRDDIVDAVGDSEYPVVMLNSRQDILKRLQQELLAIPGIGKIRVEELTCRMGWSREWSLEMIDESCWALGWITNVNKLKTDPNSLLDITSHQSKINALMQNRSSSYHNSNNGQLYDRKTLRTLYGLVLSWENN